MTHFRKWRLFAPLGLTLIGLGLSLTGHSISLKINDAPTLTWFLWGTLSLIMTNAGIAVFGDAIKHRTLYEMRHGESS